MGIAADDKSLKYLKKQPEVMVMF